MSEFAIAIHPVTAAQTIVRLSGRIESGDLKPLEEGFETVLHSTANSVLLDATGLESLSSSALGAMVALAANLAKRSGKLSLAVSREDLRGLLDLLGLKETLSVVENLDEARRAAQ